jgi:hypothetical protein
MTAMHKQETTFEKENSLLPPIQREWTFIQKIFHILLISTRKYIDWVSWKIGSLIQCLILLCDIQPVSCNIRPGDALNSCEFKVSNDKTLRSDIMDFFVAYGKIRSFRNISEAEVLASIQIKLFIYKSNLCEVSDCLPP